MSLKLQSTEGTHMTTIGEVPISMEPAIPTLATPLHKIPLSVSLLIIWLIN